MSTTELYKCAGDRLSTMPDEEYSRLALQASEAFLAGDIERADEIWSLLPISLNTAVGVIAFLGEEELAGYNTKDIEAIYGNDWLERIRDLLNKSDLSPRGYGKPPEKPAGSGSGNSFGL